MATEIKVPTLGESITSATVARWIKHEGDAVAADEPLVELETDKVTVEVNAPAAGVLTSIAVPEGGEVEVGALLAMLEAGGRRPRRPLRPRVRRRPSQRLRRPRRCGQRRRPSRSRRDARRPIRPPGLIRRPVRWGRCRVRPALSHSRCPLRPS